jgi:hypothetical protein
MSPTRIALVATAIAVTVAGCGRDTRAPQSPPSAATSLSGLYVAKLDRRALARTHLPAGRWTLLIDSRSHRLVLSHANTGAFSERLTAVDDAEIRLAPSVACEQAGLGRTQPSRLAWITSGTHFRFPSIDVPSFTAGTYLRFQPIDVPCRATGVLLTSSLWHKA